MGESNENKVPVWVWYVAFVAACFIGRYMLDQKSKSDIARYKVDQMLGPAPKQDWDNGGPDPYP